MVLVAVVVLVGGGDDDDPVVGGQTTRTRSGDLVTSVADMRRAAVQIEATGRFREPDEDPFDETGRGSGFLIDPSGIVVTNNHVVGGATSVIVFVGGSPTPVSARVLGVSQCSDLAVLQIEGSGYPYVEWFQGEALPPLDVYAAGFPLGDPEFTLTRGIVAKARANGESSFASVPHVIEHDAAIQPGNSGGALITADAKVVAVNYATGPGDVQTQYFAIAGTIARPIVEQLRRGSDVDSIGINGRARRFRTGSVGVWVSAVAPGSIADRAGVLAGDVITHLDDQPLAVRGNMSEFCAVLRARGLSSTMSIRVERWDTDEILEGELNGQPLRVTGPFKGMGMGPTGGDTTNQPAPGTPAPAPIDDGFVQRTDDTGRISLALPAAWAQVSTRPVTDSQGTHSQLVASPDIARAGGHWDVPGLWVTVFDGAADTVEETRRANVPRDCTFERTDSYNSQGLQGTWDVYRSCAQIGATFHLFVLTDAAQRFLVLVELQLPGNDPATLPTEIAVLTEVLVGLSVR